MEAGTTEPAKPAERAIASVGRATRRGIAWNLIGALVTNGMRVAVVAVLGRLLDASEFGVVAAALSVTIVLHHIRDVGVGLALVQRRELEHGHVATAFAFSTYVGCGIAALLALCAPIIGELYRIPESVDVLRVLGLTFALRGFATVSSMMSQRAMNFRAIAFIDSMSYVGGTSVSLVLATQGFGAWSLVIGYIVEESLSTASYLLAYRPPITLRIQRERLRDLFSFGAGQSVIQLAGTFAVYGDNFVVGHSLGKVELGNYTRAYDLIKFPSAVFTNIAGNVLFPAFARLQDEHARLATVYSRVTFGISLILLPASAALIATAPETIEILMGPGWSHAVAPFQILALTMMFRTSYKVGAMVASAAGLVNKVAVAHVVYALLVIGGAAVTVRWGISGVAISTAFALVAVYSLCSAFALKVTKLRASALIRAHLPGILLAVVVGTAVWVLAELLRSHHVAFPWIFATSALSGAAITLGAVAVCIRLNIGDFVWLAHELSAFVGRIRRKRAALRAGG